ncbi:hypothetical protein ElyMa_005967700 [Elysia marginata]|uniref:Uncharacterized protein n=1 Tax=Elysia marginata TaxID=1093978 RepID=A0AAV4GBU3_9GAST|nr:hypothetical protein ElyMa_005967700 [Elysia marginata]
MFPLDNLAALREALATLEQRFGNAFNVARALREELDAWPSFKAKDGEGLRKFVDFVKQSLAASSVVGQLNILDDVQF